MPWTGSLRQQPFRRVNQYPKGPAFRSGDGVIKPVITPEQLAIDDKAGRTEYLAFARFISCGLICRAKLIRKSLGSEVIRVLTEFA